MSMKSAGTPRRPSRGKIISLAIIAIGVAMGLYVEHRIAIRPSTDDATIDADVVHVASAVGGRIIELRGYRERQGVKGRPSLSH